jgi:hypothetical protein
VALLISLCPKVVRLCLENPSTPDETPRFVLDYMILEILHPKIREGKTLQALESLTAVTARMEGSQGGFRLASIATFFHLPNLRKVRGVACFEPEDDLFTHFDCPPRHSAVRELDFIRSAICPLGLKEMLQACKAVEKFNNDWAGLPVGWVEVNFPLLRDALLDHKSTLKSIRLDTSKHFDSWPERDNGLVPPFGPSLKEFEELRAMNVPASCLIGWDEQAVGGYDSLQDVLPPNIEELKINESAPRLLQLIEDFAPTCATSFPRLKILTISRKLAEEIDAKAEERLKQLFAQLAEGVELLFEDGEEVDHFDEDVEDLSF